MPHVVVPPNLSESVIAEALQHGPWASLVLPEPDPQSRRIVVFRSEPNYQRFLQTAFTLGFVDRLPPADEALPEEARMRAAFIRSRTPFSSILYRPQAIPVTDNSTWWIFKRQFG